MKALTSSNISDKYDKLLDRRIELSNYQKLKLELNIDNDKVEHKLKVESLGLDIAIKKNNCKC